ncbi:MAG: AcvB/VirJ family lysyl-phosphatidylglycerol hydrolase [Bacteroidales bacterium]
MKKILLLYCTTLLFFALCFHGSLFAQRLQPTKHLPIIESKSDANLDYYVILLTGNGGWRKLVQSITNYLNDKNVSVVAINTKKYLLSRKKPKQICCDLETLMDQYNNKWEGEKVVMIGYSMGAEILPFAFNCMEEKYKQQINDLILIAPGQKATFKVKLRDYYHEVNEGADIYPELQKMNKQKTYVICDDNKFSICLENLDGIVDHDFLGGGHHFGKDYNKLSLLVGKRLNLE